MGDFDPVYMEFVQGRSAKFYAIEVHGDTGEGSAGGRES